MNSFQKDWFTEEGVLNSNAVKLSLKCEEVLHQEKTKFQELLVFRSPKYGNCLILDNCIQCTDLDEFSYHEMISFLPLNSHPSPRRVLIIGGGDGGAAKEVLKHPLVEEVVLCEIDEAVIRISKKFFPHLACSFDDPKLKVHVDDGIEYVRKHKNYFDVIITDSSDPIGPAEVLFRDEYYKLLSECLRTGGIVCSQAESFWFDLDVINSLLNVARNNFKTVTYAYCLTPCYPSGKIGFLIASKDKVTNFREPIYKFSKKQQEQMQLKYYSEDMHRSAFTLPPIFVKKLNLEN